MITKVFKSGNSQAVRIPQSLKLEQSEVEIFKRGDEIIIRPIRTLTAAAAFDILASMPEPIEREEIKFQERDW